MAIRTGVLEVREKMIRFFHEMRNGETGEISAVTQLVGVHIDTLARKSCALPEIFVARAREHLVDYKLPWE